MLLPGSIIGVYLVYGTSGFEPPTVWIVPLVATCGYLGIVATRSLRPARAGVIQRLDLNWKQIVAGCCLASVINSIGHGLILGLGGINVLAFLVGDTLGTIVLMLILMLVPALPIIYYTGKSLFKTYGEVMGCFE